MIRNGMNDTFEEAYRQFYDNLTPEENILFAECASAEDLLQGFGKLQHLSRRHRNQASSRGAAAVQSICERLEPYLEAINQFFQGSPQYVSIVWGAIRFVLQMVHQYSTFFEKLMQMLEQLSEQLPQIGRVVQLVESPSSKLQNYIQDIYVGLLEFFREVVKVFSDRRGKIKRTPRIIGSVLWTPFDVRFKTIVDRLARCKELVWNEIKLMTACTSRTVQEQIEKQSIIARDERIASAQMRKNVSDISLELNVANDLIRRQLGEKRREDLRAWLNAPPFTEILQESQAKREQGTNLWIRDSTQFLDWRSATWNPPAVQRRNKFGSNCLWLHGNPGIGKTILASSIIEILSGGSNRRRVAGDTPHEKTIYYFFRSMQKNGASVAAAYRSFIAQLLDYDDNDGVFELLSFAHLDSISKHAHATLPELEELFSLCLRQSGPTFIVIDGLDESDDLSALTRQLTAAAAAFQVKLVLISRSNVATLQRCVEIADQLKLERHVTSQDVRVYIERQVDELIEEDLLPEDKDTAKLVQHLVHGADGMFLWAALMCKYLWSPSLTTGMRLRTIRSVNFPEGLEKMYDRMISLMSLADTPTRLLSRRVLLWLTYSSPQLDLRQLENVVLTCMDEDPTDLSNRYKSFAETVVAACGGMVEIVEPIGKSAGKSSLRFIHATVMEHFKCARTTKPMENDTCGAVPEAYTADVDILMDCLLGLTTRLPSEHAVNAKRIPTSIGDLHQYATFRWTHHASSMNLHTKDLSRAIEEQKIVELAKALENFFNDPIAISMWIAGSYQLDKSDYPSQNTPLQDSYLRIESWITWILELPDSILADNLRPTVARMKRFADHVKHIFLTWNDVLLAKPGAIWDEIPSLTDGEFYYRKNKSNVYHLTPKPPAQSDSALQPLCSESSTDSTGSYTVVLTAWPCREFDNSFSKLSPQQAFVHADKFSKSWSAKAEIWSTELTPKLLGSCQIAIPEAEVALHIRQTLCTTTVNIHPFRTTFPLIVNADCHTLVILRTVYWLKLAPDNTNLTWISHTVPLDEYPQTRDKWIQRPGRPTISDHHSSSQQSGRCLPVSDWYTYAFEASSDGKYLFFADHRRVGQSCYLIFALCRTERLYIEKIMTGKAPWPSPLPRKIAFSTNKYLTFAYSYSHGSDIRILDLVESKSIGDLVIATLSVLFQGDDVTVVRMLIIRIGKHVFQGSMPVDFLGFSSCSRYLVVTHKTSSKIIPIPERTGGFESMAGSSSHLKQILSAAGRTGTNALPVNPTSKSEGTSNPILAIERQNDNLVFTDPSTVQSSSLVTLRPGEVMTTAAPMYTSLGKDGHQIISINDTSNTGAISLTSIQQVPNEGDHSFQETFWDLPLAHIPKALVSAERRVMVKVLEEEEPTIRMFMNVSSSAGYDIRRRGPGTAERQDQSGGPIIFDRKIGDIGGEPTTIVKRKRYTGVGEGKHVLDHDADTAAQPRPEGQPDESSMKRLRGNR